MKQQKEIWTDDKKKSYFFVDFLLSSKMMHSVVIIITTTASIVAHQNVDETLEKDTKKKSLIFSHFIASIKCDCNRTVDQFIETKERCFFHSFFFSVRSRTESYEDFSMKKRETIVLHKINTNISVSKQAAAIYTHTITQIDPFRSVPIPFAMPYRCCCYCKWPTTQHSVFTTARGHRKRRTSKENVELK